MDTKTTSFIGLIVLIGVAIVVLLQSIFTLNEAEQAMITQFGEIKGEPVTDSGLHFKLPFIQKVSKLDKRILSWDGESNELPTKDKLFIRIDTFARWRIQDPKQFFLRLRNERTAQSRLDDLLDSAAREAIASHVLLEIVRSENREPSVDEQLDYDGSEIVGQLQEITTGRENIEEMIVQGARPTLANLGIELLDVQIKRLNYNQNVQQQIFQRMISERQQIAARFLSEGEGEAARILGQRDRELRTLESEAYKQVQEIKGRADAEASAIYAEAYGGSDAAQRYYEFIKTMETFELTMSDETMMLMSTESDLFKYLKGIDPVK